MGSKTDKIKGRIKEAVGALTDNDNLKREGQRDQAVGEVKEAAESAAEKVKDKVARAVEKVKNAGMWLTDIFGAGYFTIGNAMWDGVYLGLNGAVTQPQEMTIPVIAVDPDGYENFFHASGDAAFLLSLHGPLHSFLLLPRPLRDAGFSVNNNWDFRVDLTKRFDALVYVELTTPTHPLPPPN